MPGAAFPLTVKRERRQLLKVALAKEREDEVFLIGMNQQSSSSRRHVRNRNYCAFANRRACAEDPESESDNRHRDCHYDRFDHHHEHRSCRALNFARAVGEPLRQIAEEPGERNFVA